jgi:hypothetical protein
MEIQQPKDSRYGAVMLPWAEKPTPLGGGEVTKIGYVHIFDDVFRPLYKERH